LRDKSAGGDFILAAVVAALGLLLLVGAREIRFGAGYDRIGPRFFPYVVAGGLIALGALLAASALRRKRGGEAEEVPASEDGISWLPLGLLGSALLLDALLLERVGFVVASTAQFWLTARAFKSRRPIRDAVVALVLSLTVYYAFSRGLGLSLPPGILESLS
jgi:putative tricarboxylic transport membrane protein